MNQKELDTFEVWQQQWDVLSKEFAQNHVEELTSKPSWLTSTLMDTDYKEKELTVDPSWNDIYNMSQDTILNEVKFDKGEAKPDVSFGGFTPTKTNPTKQDSVGPDNKLRVTDNWIGGDDLNELDEIKHKLETMERKYHEKEYEDQRPSKKMKKTLENLRDRITKLSEKINKIPTVDVT